MQRRLALHKYLVAPLPIFSGGSRPQGGGASSSAMPARQDAAPPCACGLRNDAPYLPSFSLSKERRDVPSRRVGCGTHPTSCIPHLDSHTPRLPAAKAIPVPMGSSAKSPVKRPFRGVCPSPRSFRTRDPPMPRRVSSAQVSSTESCWLHDVRTLATRDCGNEALRKRFTCVVAYPFVRRDSRTSVALCTPRLPNCMPTSLQCRLLSF